MEYTVYILWGLASFSRHYIVRLSPISTHICSSFSLALHCTSNTVYLFLNYQVYCSTLHSHLSLLVNIWLLSLEYSGGVELLGQRVCICSASVDIASQLSKMLVPIYIPTSSVWEFQLFHVLTNTLFSVFFIQPFWWESVSITLWFSFTFP